MQITITGHNIEVTDALKDHAEEKVAKIRRFLNTTINAHVILKVEKLDHIAEIIIHANGVDFQGVDKHENMYTAIDNAMSKIDRQAKKFKGKIQARKKGAPTAAETFAEEE